MYLQPVLNLLSPSAALLGGAPPESAFGTLLYLFDTTVASSITEEGTGVSKWTDLINGYEAIQTTDANRPSLTTDGSNPRHFI